MITILLRRLPLRLVLLLALAAGLITVSWFITSAAIGDSFATFVRRRVGLDQAQRLAGADAAVRFAPRDPSTHYLRGSLYSDAASGAEVEAQLSTAVAELRTAAALSPEDYRIWLALGRALELSGVQAEARAAFERGVSLAPHHFESHWALGNYLLRRGEREAAFAQWRVALVNRPASLPLIFGYAWDAYSGDGQAIAKVLSPPAELRGQLFTLLIWRNRIDDALALWRESGPTNPADDGRIVSALIDAQRYGPAYEVWKASVKDQAPPPDEGSQLSNGGFERPVAVGSTVPFSTWRVTPGTGMMISLDGQERRSGEYSLRVGFDVKSSNELTIAAQTVVATPSTPYRLSFAAKTDQLQSLGPPPLVEVYDAGHPSWLRAASEPLPSGKSEWANYTVSFITTPGTEAVTVRVQRPPCAESPCPLQGRLWLDDFKLTPQR